MWSAGLTGDSDDDSGYLSLSRLAFEGMKGALCASDLRLGRQLAATQAQRRGRVSRVRRSSTEPEKWHIHQD